MASDFCIFFSKEEGQGMSGVCGVLNYGGCFAEAAGNVDRVNGWEAGLRDGLGYIQPFVVSCGLGQSRSHTKL